ncbi:hypothetical protein KR054_003948 [Drosophila jambulina]|nr:hypothetical protein KR054_003948 [Drosophila jambulina]
MEPREIIHYTPEEIVQQTECPACGTNMSYMKKPFSHAKKCFSIRRPRTRSVYRIFGYEECQCGLLIHNTPKAQKLHVCMVGNFPKITRSVLICFLFVFQGKIPPNDPAFSAPASPPPDQVSLPPPKPALTPLPATRKRQSEQILDDKILQSQRKKWIRNFTCPIKQKVEDILVVLPGVHKPKLTSVPRVRNFDMPNRVPSDEVSVYSIIPEDESISFADGLVIRANHGTKENILIKKQSLRLPSLKKS